MNARIAHLKATLLDAFESGLGALNPAALVEQALPPLPPKHARVRVIAAGKAALGMACGAIARWGSRIEDILVIAPSVQPKIHAAGSPPIDVMLAAHPLPDERSMAAAREALARAATLQRSDLLLALISGGASSLLSLPPEGFGLEEKRRVVAELLEGGIDIRELNTVRRHLSQIKGGRLALAASPARVLSLLLCDVLGGEPHDIGSGPTVFDPSTLEDAAEILRRASGAEVFSRAIAALSESLKPGTVLSRENEAEPPLAPRIRAKILANPEMLADAVAQRLNTKAGLAARVQMDGLQEASALAQARLALARQLSAGEAVVIPCEPTLKLPKQRGRGGRAAWVALFAMAHLPKDVVLLCGASDGVDGSSGHGGAMVCADDAAGIAQETIEQALRSFDDAALHEKLGTNIGSGPSGHNLADLHILARLPG